MPNLRTANKEFTRVIYPELSYKINGVIFAARREIGVYCNEKQYCDLIENKFKQGKIFYEREKVLPVSFSGEQSGRNKADFIIERLIVLEVKARRVLTRDDYYQLKRYLTSSNKKLGIIVNFRDSYIKPKRILN